jgi:hypothetical protein
MSTTVPVRDAEIERELRSRGLDRCDSTGAADDDTATLAGPSSGGFKGGWNSARALGARSIADPAPRGARTS